MTHPRTTIVLIVLALGVLLAFASFFRDVTPPPKNAADFPADFIFEIADANEERIRGLSGRAEIPENYGLLFVFPEPGFHGIWMKDMLVAIDIAWLDSDGTILHLEREVSPDTFPTVFYPPAPSSFVLETKAGEAQRQGWDVGTTLPLP